MHVSVAVPFRAADRNRRVAVSALVLREVMQFGAVVAAALTITSPAWRVAACIPSPSSPESVYGAIGAVPTTLFWFYLVGRLVVTAPILNVATDEEL